MLVPPPQKISLEILADIVDVPLERLIKLSRAAHRLYTLSEQPKKDGGVRIIEAPYKPLKVIQTKLHDELLARLPVHHSLHGRPGTSPLSAAHNHTGQPMVVTMDVADFFPSISSQMILRELKTAGFSPESSELITRLCTRKKRLPQGAPTSPVLGRIVASPMLSRIEGLLQSISPHCQITQFVDDFAISGPEGISRAIPTIRSICAECGFQIQDRKTKIMASSEPQEVLGVLVNSKIEPTARFLERINKARATLAPDDPHRRGLESYYRSILRAGRDCC